jgi:hypothetical protein
MNKLVSTGFVLLGLGYLLEGKRSVNGDSAAPATNGLGRVPNPGQRGIRDMKIHDISTIDQRVAFIVNQIRTDSTRPEVISAARAIVSGKCPVDSGGIDWCIRPKDHKAEIAAIFHGITNPNSPYAVRYTRDHATVDLFGSNALMSRLPAGDCDDLCIRGGAMLRAIGFDVKCRVVAPAGQPNQWAHIYLMVGNPPGDNKQWIPFDASEALHGPFWEVPHYLVSTKRDFAV